MVIHSNEIKSRIKILRNASLGKKISRKMSHIFSLSKQEKSNEIKQHTNPAFFKQFAIQPLSQPSKLMTQQELIECQALKHLFTLKDDNGNYLAIPIELTLETQDEIENSYKKQVKDKTLPDIEKVYENSFGDLAYNQLGCRITYKELPQKQTTASIKMLLLCLKDKKLKKEIEKIINSSNEEDKVLFTNCFTYFVLAHEYKHFDQFSLIAKVFDPQTMIAISRLTAYKDNRKKFAETFFLKHKNEIEKQFNDFYPQDSKLSVEEKMQKLINKEKELDEKFKPLLTIDNPENKENDSTFDEFENKNTQNLDEYEKIIFYITLSKDGFSQDDILKLQNDKEFIADHKSIYDNSIKNMLNSNLTNAQIKQIIKNSGENEEEFKKYLALKTILKIYNNALSQDESLQDSKKITNEKKEQLNKKLDNAKDDNERLKIIKDDINNKIISLSEQENKAFEFYTKIHNECEGKEISDEERERANEYLNSAINYRQDIITEYYKNPLEQEAYSYQFHKTLELYNKIKKSDDCLTSSKLLEHAIDERIKEKKQKIDEKKAIDEEKKKLIEEKMNAIKKLKEKMNFKDLDKKIDFSQVKEKMNFKDLDKKIDFSQVKEKINSKDLDKKIDFSQIKIKNEF